VTGFTSGDARRHFIWSSSRLGPGACSRSRDGVRRRVQDRVREHAHESDQVGVLDQEHDEPWPLLWTVFELSEAFSVSLER